MLDRHRCRADFTYFAENCLRVQELERPRIVPLVLKPVQKRLAAVILDDLESGRPCRLIVLKARREGVSTLVQAIFYWLASTRPHQHGMTLSHHDDTTKALFRMTERFYQASPAEIRPMRRTSRVGEILELAQPKPDPVLRQTNPGLESSLRTVTFKNAGAGQAANLVHCSEVALWGSDAEQTLSTLLPVIPYAAGTIVILESTARGVGNTFHRQWVEAGQKSEYSAGFQQFFIPWYEEPFYTLDPHPPLGVLDAREEALRQVGVRDDQLAWRRWIGIPNQPGANPSTFDQEYPESASVAFLMSGRPFFDQRVVQEYLDEPRPTPLVQGDIVEREGLALVQERPKGPLRIWQAPHDDEDYLIVCDPSEGMAGGDPQSVYITSRSELAIVAAWHGHVPRDELGDVLYRLGKLYGDALIAVEVNGGWGLTPVAILRRRGYPRIYRRATETKHRRKRTDTLGWDTTPNLRPLILDKLAQAMSDRDIAIPDEDLLHECHHFIISETGKPQAEQGYHDDRVITAALLTHLFQTHPKIMQLEQVQLRRPHARSALTGY